MPPVTVGCRPNSLQSEIALRRIPERVLQTTTCVVCGTNAPATLREIERRLTVVSRAAQHAHGGVVTVTAAAFRARERGRVSSFPIWTTSSTAASNESVRLRTTPASPTVRHGMSADPCCCRKLKVTRSYQDTASNETDSHKTFFASLARRRQRRDVGGERCVPMGGVRHPAVVLATAQPSRDAGRRRPMRPVKSNVRHETSRITTVTTHDADHVPSATAEAAERRSQL
jgi:hypothetical protein